MSSLSKTSEHIPANTFEWRDREGNFHKPENMETRHLFYTLRMIWNHSMPEEFRLTPYNSYRFGDFYTDEYMKRAIRNIAAELTKRKDMTASFKAQLKFMASVFEQKPLLLTY